MSDLKEQLHAAFYEYADIPAGGVPDYDGTMWGDFSAGYEAARRAPAAAPAPVAAIPDERQRFEAWVTRDMGPIGTKRAKERCPFEPEEYSDRIMQGRWEDWQEAARAALAAAPAAAEQDAKARADAHTTSYHQGYQAGIQMGKALAADEAAAPIVQPVGGEHVVAWMEQFTADMRAKGWDDKRIGEVIAVMVDVRINRAAIASSAGEVKHG